jgi:hypothetical protein
VGWQPGLGGTGEHPGPGAGPPDPPGPARDPRLSGFAQGGEWDTRQPSAALAVALDAASGAGWRCPGATRDELLGLLRQWQALESWAAAGKLGLLRALIRDDDQPLPGCFRYPHMDREQASWKTCSPLSMTAAGAAW